MCTGFSFMSENHQAILGRTMDFVYQLKGNPAVQPRHYYWESRVEYKGNIVWLRRFWQRYGRIFIWRWC